MLFSPKLEQHRVRDGDYESRPGDRFGAFVMMGPCGETLLIVASDGETTSWEHVSVSTRRRVPNWQEMCFVKNLFWAPEEWVVQFHPAASRYVNNFSPVLHMWRPTKQELPTPPDILVGFKELGTIGSAQ